MLRHNLLLFYRNFKRIKSTFFINLIGLSTGLTCVILIFLWVNDEIKVDKFHEKDDRLYQVMHTNGDDTDQATPGILSQSLSEEIPEVEFAVSVIPHTFNNSKGLITSEDVRIKSSGQYVSKDYLNLFSYKLLYGEKDQVLSTKNSMVISKELAVKLFGTPEKAIGKPVEWKSPTISGMCNVSGVFESPPANATDQFDFFLSYEWYEEFQPSDGWGNRSPHTFVLLKEGVSHERLNAKIRGFIKSKDQNSNSMLFLQRYSDRYLYGRYENGSPVGGRIEYVKLFSIIGVVLLIIACINFMNLSTAKAATKMKEVGVKKAIGADRKLLIFQYLGESVLMTFLSLIVALIIVQLMLPHFSHITGKYLTLDLSGGFIIILVAFSVVTGLIAGSYPALLLSGFEPINVLKGQLVTSSKEIWIRKGLVMFQFSTAIILMIFVWVVYNQVELIQSKNIGFTRDNVIYFDTEKASNIFLSELKNIPGVINAGGGNMEAGRGLGGTNDVHWEGKSPDDKTFFSNKWVSYNLIETLGMEIVLGHAFSEDFGSHNQVIFNESAILRMGIADPIGKTVVIRGEERQIVGVIKDFHFESLYEEVKPCAVLLAPMEYAPKVSVKIQAGTESAVIAKIQQIYEKHMPQSLFDFRFMDEDYQAQYAAEQRVAVLSGYFSGFTILISCLGLFGLAAFTAERRIKEIGIRKVLGSSEWKIIKLLSGDFAKMVLVAIVIALPLSYYMTSNWLDNFAYKIDLEWWYFVGAGLLTMVIALLTVSFQSVKAALMNPVESLRSE